jgi:hypothetical protein
MATAIFDVKSNCFEEIVQTLVPLAGHLFRERGIDGGRAHCGGPIGY